MRVAGSGAQTRNRLLFGRADRGVTIVPEQAERAWRYNDRAGLSEQCDVMLADFMVLPADDATYDRVYAIGSTRHAPNRTQVFRELFRVLKPGGLFAGDETVLTDRYEPDDEDHRRILDDLLRGYGLPDLITAEECCRSMLAADFELLEARDRALEGDPETLWYSPQVAKGFSIRALARSPIGRHVINRALGALVVLCPSARGMRRTSDILDAGADATIEGGRLGILTTLFFMLSRKPGGDARTSS